MKLKFPMEENLIKPEYGQLTKSCRIFAALNFFLILAVFILVFSDLIGLNLPKYYPLQRQWSASILEGPAMGYFSAVGFSIILALPISFLFYLVLPRKQRYLEIRFKTFKNLSTGFLLFGILYFVAREWQKWGIEKMGLKTKIFFGTEFWFFLAVLILFLFLLKTLLFLEKKIFD